MITGIVNASREPTIPLLVRGVDNDDHDVSAIVDTGFTGSLTLPPTLIARLGLGWLGHTEAVLADGSLHLFDVYRGAIVWDGRVRPVDVGAAETVPLVGMRLIEGHELRIQAVTGGLVTIGALPLAA